MSNFPFATTEADLRERFEAFGAVRSVRIIVDRETGRSRGYAFVELVDGSAVDGMVESLDGTEMNGRRIAVSRARGRAGSGSASAPGAPSGAVPSSAGDADGEPFRHRVVVEWVEEESAYEASVPDLGVVARARSMEAALREVRTRAGQGGACGADSL